MQDEQPASAVILESLREQHRQLDEKIRVLSSEPTGDQLELARLKRQKLQLKDQIEQIVDAAVPDISA